MKKGHFLILTLLLFSAAALRLSAQNTPGSIGASWDKASGVKPPFRKMPPVHRQMEKDAPADYTTWDKQRSPESSPWPPLPKSPTAAQYLSANGMIIDSLQNLYCLSSGYLRTLRARNEASMRGIQPLPGKDFQYYPQMRPAGESPDHLYRELMQLLHDCLYGR